MKEISYRIRYSNLQEMATYVDINASKDKVNQLDKECHDILIDKIKCHPDIIGYISEEGVTITFTQAPRKIPMGKSDL
jgi:fructose-1,6-bisphosphatase